MSTAVGGLHAVTALLRHYPERIERLYLPEGELSARLVTLAHLAKAAGVVIEHCSRRDLQTHLPAQLAAQGVVAICHQPVTFAWHDLERWLKEAESPPVLVVLDGVQDPHNLGACLRSANAFGAMAVVVPSRQAVSLTPTVMKVACGAAQITPLVQVTNLSQCLRALQALNVWLVGLDMAGELALPEVDLKGPTALVLGGEGQGLRRLSRERCDYLARIPTIGSVESLNVSVSCGVALYELARQRGGAL